MREINGFPKAAGFLLLAALASVLMTGCAKAPEAEMEAAEEALLAARADEAEFYAREELSRAQDAINEARTEIEVQDQKWVKDYDKARELLESARRDAENAKVSAGTNKEQTRIEAEAAIAEGKGAIDHAASVLRSAPVGKGTRADIALYTSDLEQLRIEIVEAEAAMSSGKYWDALDKANAVRDKAQRIDSDVQLVLDKTRRGRTA
jgi:hypothetical protein